MNEDEWTGWRKGQRDASSVAGCVAEYLEEQGYTREAEVMRGFAEGLVRSLPPMPKRERGFSICDND